MAKHNLLVSDVPAVPFPIQGTTPPDGATAKLLNLDLRFGVPVALIILAPGTRIPAHYHDRTAEMHYVLEGDFIEAGVEFGPGAFFSHEPGTVHGPHESKNGATILTIQPEPVDASDFHLAPGERSTPAT